jgi:hypothetical protein
VKQKYTIFLSLQKIETRIRFPYGNSYVLNLTTPIKDIIKVELLSASIPNSIYNVTETEGIDILGCSNITSSNTSGNYANISIPPGFYSGSGIATELQNAEFSNCNINISYLSNEGKLLFTRPVNSFAIKIPNPNVAELLGFNNDVEYGSNVADLTNLGVNNIPIYAFNRRYIDSAGAPLNFLKSEKILNLNINEGIFLDIEELRTTLNETALAQTNDSTGFYTGQNVSRSFGQIPMDVSRGEVKKFKKATDFDLSICYPQVISSIDRITVRWTDRFNQLVNFNGVNDNSFILRFHTLRRNLI